MSLSIHTNYSSLVTQNQLGKTNSMLSSAMERLGTGLRINSAADDAAGLQIAVRLQSQSNGLKTAQRNAQDGISMLQTAEGAFDEITNIGHRMKDLATQAANDTNGVDERAAMQSEFDELAKELTSIMSNTEYGSGNKLLTGGKFASAVTLQIGASAAEKLTVDVSTNITAVEGAITAITAGTLDTSANATAAMGLADALTGEVGTIRGQFGANINRLDHTINNLGNMDQNVELSKGRIMDADFASESSNMTKNQMLMQSGMSVLSNANQISGMVTSLLR
ncbi:lateral flagellin LafA [Thalassotalea sp. PLHSN55]|uniref:lateral flagellin LafA n=1 Tax=Thalassotalea sp. PLHSN55 TaxID=3435888 RepID=UPI003F8390FC